LIAITSSKRRIVFQLFSVAGAVLANGFAANALDIDDGHRLVKGHPGACTLPVILAAGEMVPSCSGKAFLTALVIGYEIGIRAGLIRHALYRTYHSSKDCKKGGSE
jgi:2-methylcitrate dehydratase PrpD